MYLTVTVRAQAHQILSAAYLTDTEIFNVMSFGNIATVFLYGILPAKLTNAAVQFFELFENFTALGTDFICSVFLCIVRRILFSKHCSVKIFGIAFFFGQNTFIQKTHEKVVVYEFEHNDRP